jgi:hypothetical protein
MMVMSRGIKVALHRNKGLMPIYVLRQCFTSNLYPSLLCPFWLKFHKARTTVNIHIWHMRMNCACCTHTDSIDNRGHISWVTRTTEGSTVFAFSNETKIPAYVNKNVGPLKRTLITLHCERVNRLSVSLAPLLFDWEMLSVATGVMQKLQEITSSKCLLKY